MRRVLNPAGLASCSSSPSLGVPHQTSVWALLQAHHAYGGALGEQRPRGLHYLESVDAFPEGQDFLEEMRYGVHGPEGPSID